MQHDDTSASTGEEVENFRDRNAELRTRFLECNVRLKQAREAGDTEAEASALRDRERVGDEFVRLNVRLGMHNAKPFLIGDAHNRKDHVQAALLGMWEAFVGTSPDKVDAVTVDETGSVHADAGWDPQRGTFATLAKRHIRGQVRRSVKRTELAYVGMSYNTWSDKPKVDQARAALAEALGRTPTVAEIAAKAGVTIDTVRACTTATPVSLQSLISDDGTMTLGDTIEADLSGITGHEDADEADAFLAQAAEGDLDYHQVPGFGGMSAYQVGVMLMRNGLHDCPERHGHETAGLLCIGRGMIGTSERRAQAHLSHLRQQLQQRMQQPVMDPDEVLASIPAGRSCRDCGESFTYNVDGEPELQVRELALPEHLAQMNPVQRAARMAQWKAEVDALQRPGIARHQAELATYVAGEVERAARFSAEHEGHDVVAAPGKVAAHAATR